jgi:lincosamide nucleotidyltransferase A/C/D/E
VQAAEVLRVLDALDVAGIRAGITGGWGIDALLRRETRSHGDVDLGVASETVEAAIDAMRPLGYAVSTDERPARVVLTSDVGQVDLHPIVWDAAGVGVQTGLDGERFRYPAGSLEAEGEIGGRVVRCGTPELQVSFHSHYEPRQHDRRDMIALAAAFDLSLPRAYADRRR